MERVSRGLKSQPPILRVVVKKFLRAVNMVGQGLSRPHKGPSVVFLFSCIIITANTAVPLSGLRSLATNCEIQVLHMCEYTTVWLARSEVSILLFGHQVVTGKYLRAASFSTMEGYLQVIRRGYRSKTICIWNGQFGYVLIIDNVTLCTLVCSLS